MQKSVRPFLLDKFLICTCKPFVTCQKISKYGFGECYQSVHTAVTNGHRCGGERPLCGASGQSVNHI